MSGIPITVFSTRGQVYSACFVLSIDGYIYVYGSDRTKLTNSGETMYFKLYF